MSKKLIRWFEIRRKIESIKMLLQHVQIVVNSVEELVNGTNLAIAGKEIEFQESLRMHINVEREGDNLRRRIISELAKEEIPPDERVGLMRLARQIDWISDWALEAQRILSIFMFRGISNEIKNFCVEMLKTVRKCALTVQDCIRELADKKIVKALELCDAVERLEEEVDAHYQNARKLVYELGCSDVNLGSSILLVQFLDAIENIADRCEDTCDQVRVIAVAVSETV